MDIILRKNEAEINESVAKGLLIGDCKKFCVN